MKFGIELWELRGKRQNLHSSFLPPSGNFGISLSFLHVVRGRASRLRIYETSQPQQTYVRFLPFPQLCLFGSVITRESIVTNVEGMEAKSLTARSPVS